MSQYPTVGTWPNNNAGRYGVSRCTRLPDLTDRSSHCVSPAVTVIVRTMGHTVQSGVYISEPITCISNIVVSILITAFDEALNVVKMMRLAIIFFLCLLIIAGNSRIHRSVYRDICLSHYQSKCIHV